MIANEFIVTHYDQWRIQGVQRGRRGSRPHGVKIYRHCARFEDLPPLGYYLKYLLKSFNL